MKHLQYSIVFGGIRFLPNFSDLLQNLQVFSASLHKLLSIINIITHLHSLESFTPFYNINNYITILTFFYVCIVPLCFHFHQNRNPAIFSYNLRLSIHHNLDTYSVIKLFHYHRIVNYRIHNKHYVF